MAFKPQRRLTDRISGSPSLIASGVRLIGNLTCDGDLIVAGFITGESNVRGALTLLETGRWEGNIAAANAVIGGRVEGNVVVSERLEVRKGADIQGSVHARIIAVAEGALINGEMGMTADASVIRFEEKRKKI